jgi:hypothetical protein
MKLIFNPSKALLFLAFSTLFVLAGCKKEESGSVSQEEFASQASTEADTESEFVYSEIFDNVMGVNNDVGMAGVGGVFGRVGTSSPVTGRVDACPTVTVTHLNAPDNFPVKIVLDFGSGCTGRDGRFRSGKIITTYTNRLIYPGAKATTTFDGYQLGDVKVQGTHVVTNLSTAPSGTNNIVQIWKVVVEGGKLTRSNGNYTEWNSTKTITQLEGSNTPLVPLDDIYKITGSTNGKVKRGDLLVAWKAETIEPLIKKFNCRWLVKGVLKVVRINLSNTSQWVAVLNYGNGDCDRKAIVTINGVAHEITLP